MSLPPQVSLPSIPSLPPIQLPQSSSLSTQSQSLPTDPEFSSLLHPSHNSSESFSTTDSALTPTVDPETVVSPLATSSLAPPQSLRKSLSVDSFANYGQDTLTRQSSRPNRINTNIVSDHSRTLLFTNIRREREQRSRNRGASVSTTEEEYEHSLVGDSDVERLDPLARPGEGLRRSSLKGPDPSRPGIRGGELSLPSRAPNLSLASGSPAVRHEIAPRLQSSSSLQAIPRQSTGSNLRVQPGRTRSGSLGMQTARTPNRILINTQILAATSQRDVTLAVVGTIGCGKSTVIRKGLKGYRLTEPHTFSAMGIPGAHRSARYTRRVGQISHNEQRSDCALHVLEVDAAATRHEPSIFKSSNGWAERAPRVDGVILCYDVSDESSFRPVEDLLRSYRALKLPFVALACKSDLQHQVDSRNASQILRQYDSGLIEVTVNSDEGKERLRQSFDWLLKAIFRERRNVRTDTDADYRNPASPDILNLQLPWENSRTATPTGPSGPSPLAVSLSMSALDGAAQAAARPLQGPLPVIPPSRSPSLPNSPTRARSTGDLLSENEKAKAKNRGWEAGIEISGRPGLDHGNTSSESLHEAGPSANVGTNGIDERQNEKKPEKDKESRPGQWATLEELLDKLLFLAISGDDPAYITHFLLTYRRFASPRSVLLGMQKRMRQLDDPSGDPMFACFAQMRICHLLEQWIRDYPHDFAVRGTSGALAALIKSIIAKTYLLHYGSDFLPFLELLPNLVDKNPAWALKLGPDDSADESDDSYSAFEDDDDNDEVRLSEYESLSPGTASPASTRGKLASSPAVLSRERKASLPLTAKALVIPNIAPTLGFGHSDVPDSSSKHLIKDLLKVAQEVNALDSNDIAQEITRIEAKLFLEIEPRHWLQYTLVSGKKDPQTDSISRFNLVSNHIADWVVSLILCHDRPKARAKQIEKFVDVAQKLRTLNNYSALRAFVAGINNSAYPGDQTLEEFKKKSPEQAKNLQSWDLLLQHKSSHRNYRMALRHTKGACIPALEVHMSDLIKAHEGNLDINDTDPTKIHWGKFNMMGKFITGTTQCQIQCRTTNEYNFTLRDNIRSLLFAGDLMNADMQKSRMAPLDADGLEDYRPTLPRTSTRDGSTTNQPRDMALIRKLIFW